MKHFEAAVQCPYCSHKFRVCWSGASQPGPEDEFTARCPMNGSDVQVSGSQFQPVERCAGKAVQARMGR
jgi:hypothetical protein